MTPPPSDEPGSIGREEARETFVGRGGAGTGTTIYATFMAALDPTRRST